MMSSDWTYQESVSYELHARHCEPFNLLISESAKRMLRFDRCFLQARKKIKAGKGIDALHHHEIEALEDAAAFDGVCFADIFSALQTA